MLTLMSTGSAVARNKLDARIVTFWLHVELGAVAIFVAVVWLCGWLGRLCAKKTLHGQTVLITNADGALVEALADQLTDVYHCRVVLVRRRGGGERTEVGRGHTLQHHLRTEYECDVLDSGELMGLQERLRKEFGYVDVVIENGMLGTRMDGMDVRRFIETTSDGIRSTINLLIAFIPSLAQSERGHYVTIQPSTRAARPFLDSSSDVRRLITHLQSTANDRTPSPMDDDDWSSSAMQLTTVVLHEKDASSACSTASGRDLSATELAERVIAGIRREQTLLELRERRSVLEYAVDLVWR